MNRQPGAGHIAWVAALIVANAAVGAPGDLNGRALEALRRGVEYLLTEAAREGAYAREPGGLASASLTAAVAQLLLDAHALTDEAMYAEGALVSARSLARVQLQSGGWAEFYPSAERPAYLRAESQRGLPSGGRANTSELYLVSIPAARVLLQAGERFHDAALAAAADYTLRALLQAQLDDGRWPAQMPPLEPPAGVGPTADVAALLAEAVTLGRGWCQPALDRANALLPARPPEHSPTRRERLERTLARAPAVARLLNDQDDRGRWPGDGLPAQLEPLRLLLEFIRDWEPLPDLPPDARPPQHRP